MKPEFALQEFFKPVSNSEQKESSVSEGQDFAIVKTRNETAGTEEFTGKIELLKVRGGNF